MVLSVGGEDLRGFFAKDLSSEDKKMALRDMQGKGPCYHVGKSLQPAMDLPNTTRKCNIFLCKTISFRGEIKPPRIYHYLGDCMEPPINCIFFSANPNSQGNFIFS